MQTFQFFLFLDDTDFSEDTSAYRSGEELQAQDQRNGNPIVLVSAFIIYLYKTDQPTASTSLINQGNSRKTKSLFSLFE